MDSSSLSFILFQAASPNGPFEFVFISFQAASPNRPFEVIFYPVSSRKS